MEQPDINPVYPLETDGKTQWFFFDDEGVAHYYENYDECCAAAALTWGFSE